MCGLVNVTDSVTCPLLRIMVRENAVAIKRFFLPRS